MEVQHGRSPRYARAAVVCVGWNIACPYVYKSLFNAFVLPKINTYINEFYLLAPPLVGEMDYGTAFLLIFLLSVRMHFPHPPHQ